MMRHYWPLAVALTALHCAATATEIEIDSTAQRLAASCANCHGTNGISADGKLPQLAGLSQNTMVTRMQEFKAGTRAATVMQQLVKGYTDRQLALIAGYFAAQKK